MNRQSANTSFFPAATISLALLLSPVSLAATDTTDYETMLADGQAATLVSNLEQQLEATAPSAELHYWLARGQLEQIDDAWVLRKLSLARSAREHLESALALDDQHVATRFALGRYYLDAPSIAGGSRDKALDQAQALMELDPAQSYALMADIANADEAYEEAIDYDRKALAAGDWDWESQYTLAIRSVFFEVAAATEVLDEAESNIREFADKPEQLLPLIGYQRGKLAAMTGQSLDAGLVSLEQYLQYEPAADEPAHVWAEFRLAQIERQLGRENDASERLSRLEALDVDDEDLGFALQDERRWHYENQ